MSGNGASPLDHVHSHAAYGSHVRPLRGDDQCFSIWSQVEMLDVVRFGTLRILEITGRPASYSSAAEPAWKATVREAVRKSGMGGTWTT